MATLNSLRHRADELTATLQLLSAKILALDKARVTETSAAAIFQLNTQLAEARAERDALDGELEDVQRRISEIVAARSTGGAAATPGKGGGVERNSAGEPFRFDLSDTTNACLGALLRRANGLIGFSVCCNSHRFLNNLCERLRHELFRPNISLRNVWSISPIHTPLERVLENIKKYRPRLNTGDVLVAVDVPNKETAERLWEALCREFGGELSNRLIVILAVPGDECSPAGTTAVASPVFTEVHVFQWVRDVVVGQRWPPEFIDDWVEIMVRECVVGDQLEIDTVYEYLNDMLELIKQCPSHDDFRSRLEERGKTYV